MRRRTVRREHPHRSTSHAASPPDEEGSSGERDVADQCDATDHAPGDGSRPVHQHGGTEQDTHGFYGQEDRAVVRRIPVGHRTVEAPRRERKEVGVSILAVQGKIRERMKRHAREQGEQRSGVEPPSRKSRDADQRKRVEAVEERLPAGLEVALRPDRSLGRTSHAALPEVEDQHREIRHQRTDRDGQRPAFPAASTEDGGVEDDVGGGVQTGAGYHEAAIEGLNAPATDGRLPGPVDRRGPIGMMAASSERPWTGKPGHGRRSAR